MKWIKASERMPLITNGFAKQIVTKWTFDKVTNGESNIQMRTTTTNQFIDLLKEMIDLRKVEWLDESETTTPEVGKTIEEIFDRKYEIYRNLENNPPIPLLAKTMILQAMSEWAAIQCEAKDAEIKELREKLGESIRNPKPSAT